MDYKRNYNNEVLKMRRDKRQKQIALQVSIALMAGMFSFVPVVHGAPVESPNASTTATIKHGVITNASGVVTGNDANYTSINSTTQNNVIDWQDFSVAQGETVQFDGGAKTNNYMNIVTGANTSDINGAIKGGNEVYLINPNGIIFGKDASVSDVGSFYASTREVAVTDAVNAATAGNMGALVTAGTSTSGAAMDIVNMGKISADKVVLEGENIRLLNSADITATNGVTVRADEGYIHVGSANGTGGTGYTSEALTSSGTAATIENYTLVDSTNWNTTLGTGAAVSGNYMLAEDIDASAISGFKNVASFTGKIDGNFYAVKNITNGTSGLFTSTNNATIVNMGVKDSTFSASGGDTGAFIQTAVNTTLINVYNDNANITDAGDYSAGLVGFADGITIKSSYSTGNVSYGNSSAGVGIVGYLNGGTNNTVTDSYSTGKTYNGLISSGDNSAKIEFNRTLSKGTAFHDSYSQATIKNSVVVGNNQYRVADSSGVEVDKLSATIDLTALTNLISGQNNHPSWSTVTDITDTGGLLHSGTKLVRPTWRIYEGKTEPVLTAFQKGIKTTDYKYEYFDSSNVIDTAAAKYNNGANNGQDMTPYTYGTTLDGLVYNGDTLKIVDSSSNAATSNATTHAINDASTVFKTTANSASTIDTSHVFYNDAGQHDATYTPPATGSTTGTQNKLAFIWSDQNGYDLVGNNISIAPRQVTLTNNLSGQTIIKEYDGSYDAASYVPGLFNGTSTTSSGILSVDSGSIKVGFDQTSNPTATFVNRGSTTGDANVGADKQVLINGKILLTDSSGKNAYAGHNYVIVDSSGNPTTSVQLNTTVDAAIYQRKLQASFNGTGITKTYDKDEFVKDSNGNLRSFGQSDFTLNTGNIVPADVSNVNLTVATTNNAQYIDKTTGQVQVNVGTHDVAVGGVTLTGSAAKNYTLVDASGNPIYSELGIVTGFQQQGSPIGTGTGGGTFYATGDITLRSLGDTGYNWFDSTTNGTPNYQTATKEYDGQSAYVPKSQSSVVYVSNAGSASSSATTGMVAGDNLDFQVTSAEFTDDSTNVNSTAVRDANTTSTPQGVRYTVTVSGSAAGNYTFDSAAAIAAGTAAPLSNGGTAKVMGEGNITPRTIWVTAPQVSVADKTYDGDAYVKDANGNSTFDLTSGYLQYANQNTYQQLVSGDGSSIVINGLYQAGTNSAGYSYAGKDVNYDATNTTNPVLAKDIVYTAKIMQNNQLSTNYVFNINNSNQATFNGKGTIKPVQLGAITFGNISKTYDGSAAVTNTNNTTAPQYTADIIKINTPTGIIPTERISDVFYVDSNGNLDSTGAALLANGTFKANYGDLGSGGFTLNSHVKRDPQNLSTILPRDVEYAGISSLMKNHNYVLPATTAASDKVYGSGTINPFLVTDKSWIKLDRNSTPITKVYDGYDTIASPMSYLNTTGNNKANATVTTPAGKVLPGLASTVAGAKYSSEHSNGNTAQDVIYTVDFLETGDYGIDSSLKNSSGQVELTLTGDGLITQKHIIANTPKDPNVTKTYDATDAISKTGNALVDISSGILPIDQSRVTNGTTAKYIANANGAAADASTNSGDKTVEYTLALNGDSFQDYLLDDGNGNTTFTGAGTIDKRNLVITGNTNHNKQYDGTSTVTDMPTSLSGFTFGDAQDTTVLNRDNFDITKLSGLYGSGNTDATFASNPNVSTSTKDVQYSGFFTALGSKAKNYTINGTSYSSTGSTGTAYGHGIISPATFNGIFVFRLKPGITQTYSGYADVGHEEANQQAFQESWIDLDKSGVYLNGTTITGTPDITLRNGAYTYTINSALYTAGPDAGTGKEVKYNITLTPTTLANYGITSSSAVPLDNQAIQDGVITAREVTVDLSALAKGGLSKYYDNTGTIYNNDNK
ncbi:filamentous hemagglutinin N-terminal domain-containing protein, partial [Selenomonas ruminantium]|uniref:beta strand repeat-containing protein n=1 Tax=Selenomonas ruminantium TaxID=971 RepID=UPI0026EE59F5